MDVQSATQVATPKQLQPATSEKILYHVIQISSDEAPRTPVPPVTPRISRRLQ